MTIPNAPQGTPVQQNPAFAMALLESLTKQRDSALNACAQFEAQAAVFAQMLTAKDREIADLQATLAAATAPASGPI